MANETENATQSQAEQASKDLDALVDSVTSGAESGVPAETQVTQPAQVAPVAEQTQEAEAATEATTEAVADSPIRSKMKELGYFVDDASDDELSSIYREILEASNARQSSSKSSDNSRDSSESVKVTQYGPENPENGSKKWQKPELKEEWKSQVKMEGGQAVPLSPLSPSHIAAAEGVNNYLRRTQEMARKLAEDPYSVLMEIGQEDINRLVKEGVQREIAAFRQEQQAHTQQAAGQAQWEKLQSEMYQRDASGGIKYMVNDQGRQLIDPRTRQPIPLKTDQGRAVENLWGTFCEANGVSQYEQQYDPAFIARAGQYITKNLPKAPAKAQEASAPAKAPPQRFLAGTAYEGQRAGSVKAQVPSDDPLADLAGPGAVSIDDAFALARKQAAEMGL